MTNTQINKIERLYDQLFTAIDNGNVKSVYAGINPLAIKNDFEAAGRDCSWYCAANADGLKLLKSYIKAMDSTPAAGTLLPDINRLNVGQWICLEYDNEDEYQATASWSVLEDAIACTGDFFKNFGLAPNVVPEV